MGRFTLTVTGVNIPALEGYTHEHKPYDPNPGLLHWLHIVINNAKKHLQEMLLESLLARYPKDSGLYGYRGYVNCEKKRYDEAIKDCDQAIAISKGKPNRRYYNTRGRCCWPRVQPDIPVRLDDPVFDRHGGVCG